MLKAEDAENISKSDWKNGKYITHTKKNKGFKMNETDNFVTTQKYQHMEGKQNWQQRI